MSVFWLGSLTRIAVAAKIAGILARPEPYTWRSTPLPLHTVVTLNFFVLRGGKVSYKVVQRLEAVVFKARDDSLEGKILTLKQQYTLCSASLQDIITCFEKMSRETMMWNEFPQKVVVQMNDTHPTLCIPDDEDIHFVRTMAYTNHTVLPEALTKSQWRAAKRINKLKVVSFLKEKTGYSVSPNAMFDIQVEKALSNVQMKTKECIEAGDMKRLRLSRPDRCRPMP
ncbi:alpha-1,4 glucan phosphorylase L isozyme, chloroplastic/amyloplastic isoform X2 [Tanacetum coccineum]